MRAPEYQLLEHLNIFELSLSNGSHIITEITSLINNLKDNESALLDKSLLEMNIKALPASLNLSQYEQAFSIFSDQGLIYKMQQIINFLITKGRKNESIDEEEFEKILSDMLIDDYIGLASLFNSPFNNYPGEDTSEHLNFFAAIFSIIFTIKPFIEKFCEKYQITMPQDTSYLVLKAEEDDESTQLSLDTLEEVSYLFELLKSPIKNLLALHPVRDMPFLRHLDLSDKIIEEITAHQHNLSDNIQREVESCKQEVQKLITQNNYPENLTTDLIQLVRQQSQKIESTQLKLLIVKNYISELKNNSISVFALPNLTTLINDLEQLQEINLEISVNTAKLVGINTMAEVIPPNHPLFNKITSPENSRLGKLETLVKNLVQKIQEYQLLAMKSPSTQILDQCIPQIRENVTPVDNNLKSLKNTISVSIMNNDFKACLDELNPAKSSSATTTLTDESSRRVRFFVPAAEQGNSSSQNLTIQAESTKEHANNPNIK